MESKKPEKEPVSKSEGASVIRGAQMSNRSHARRGKEKEEKERKYSPGQLKFSCQ